MLEVLSISLVTLVFAILSVAFFSAFERKVLGVIQLRIGPSKLQVIGFSQPIADAVNLLSKEEEGNAGSSTFLFYFSPVLIIGVSLSMWLVYPHEGGLLSWESSVLYLLLLLSSGVYGVIVLGWFSNSNYARLGAARAAVQSISYEVGLAISILFLALCYSSTTLFEWTLPQEFCWSAVWMPFIFLIFLTMLLVEANRSPFDLSEGESELVSGFCVEYGGAGYTVVFLSENLALMWSLLLSSTSFLGGGVLPLLPLLFYVVWVRASMPRIRIDKLIGFFWSGVLPLLFLLFSVYVVLV